MLVQTLIYSLCLASMVIIAILVLLRNRKPVFVFFSLFSLMLALFSLLQFLATSTTDGEIWTQLSFLSSEILGPLFFAFVHAYPSRKRLSVKWLLALCIPLVVLGPLSFSSLLIKSFEPQFVPGPLYNVQSGIVVAFFVASFILFLRRLPKIDPGERKQMYFLLFATLLPVVTLTVTGTVLVNVKEVSVLRPISILAMVLILAYTMIYHRLFDIRLVVARSLTYLVSLVILATIYGLLVFGLTNLVFHLQIQAGIEVLIASATAVSSLFFSTLKRFFDHVTRRLFYQDAYDTQSFLDEFNSVLVSTYGLHELVKRSTAVIEKYLRPSYCTFSIHEGTRSGEQRVIGDVKYPAFRAADIQEINELSSSLHEKIIAVDDIEEQHVSLKKALARHDIDVLARLTTNVKGEGIGYLILGIKKNGRAYSKQDLKVIEIVSNELVIAVQNALRTEEIQNFNITLQSKIDEATRKLRRTNEKLKEMDETKDDFISMASHQLRTPLTSVKGYISMVLEEDAGKITHMQREMLSQAFFSSQRMVYLIADLLNVSRLKTGKFVIEPSRINLADMVQQELEQLEETAASRSLTLQYDKPAGFPTVMLDETKTRQVIMNFVDNAIYYTQAGGHITVRLINDPSTIELRVEDNGIGVPKAEQHHLFTKFYRAGNARKARPDGTGLGLFMAKKVIVAEGGSIIFESQEGKGSTFGFIFSKAKVSAHAAGPAAADKKAPEPAKQG